MIRNVVDLSRFEYRERQPLRPRLLSTRNLEPYYRVDVILEAFALVKAQLPDATLTVAGYGSEEARLRRLAGRGGPVRRKGRPAVDAAAVRRGRHLPERVGRRQPTGLDPRGVRRRPPGRLHANGRHSPRWSVTTTPASSSRPRDAASLASAVLQLIACPGEALRDGAAGPRGRQPIHVARGPRSVGRCLRRRSQRSHTRRAIRVRSSHGRSLQRR